MSPLLRHSSSIAAKYAPVALVCKKPSPLATIVSGRRRGMTQDELYLRAIVEFGPALARLARAYEQDADQRRDLLQDVNFALWRSFASFAGQCSLRTWVYRVAHNTA